MSFHVSGLKQENENEISIDVLFCSNSELLLRKLMWKAKIVILNIKQYDKEDITFGDNFWVIDYNWQLISIVTRFEDIRESTNFLIEAWIRLVKIWSFSNSLTTDEYIQILNEEQASYQAKIQASQAVKNVAQENEKKIYENQKMHSIQEIITKVFDRIQETFDLVSWNVSWSIIKKLRDLQEELKKDRMWTNYDKITMTIDNVFNVIDEIQEEFLQNIKDKESIIIKDSHVTSFDTFKEYNAFYRSEIIKNLSEIHKKEDRYYIFLWKDGIFLKFLKIDFIKKFSDFTSVLFGLYTFAELLIIAIIIEMVAYMLFSQKILGSQVDLSAFNILVNFWILWFVTYFFRKFLKKKLMHLILFIPLIACAYFILYYIIKVNFAL